MMRCVCSGTRSAPAAWEVAELFDPALRVFQFRLGPSGARRGLAGRAGRGAAPPLAWYVNGQLAPDLQLRRGLVYSFKVRRRLLFLSVRYRNSLSLYHDGLSSGLGWQ